MKPTASTIESLATLARLGIRIRCRANGLDLQFPWGARDDRAMMYIESRRDELRDACRGLTDYDDVVFPLSVRSDAALNVICLHPISGSAFDYRHLAAELAEDCSVFGIQAHYWFSSARPPASLSQMAALYAKRLLHHPATRRPFVLYGASSGGYLALEVSTRLAEHGRDAELIVLGDTRDSIRGPVSAATQAILMRLRWISFVELCLPLELRDISPSAHEFWRLPRDDRIEYLCRRASALEAPMCFAPLSFEALSTLYSTFRVYLRAYAEHEPESYAGRAAFIATSDAPMSRTERVRRRLTGETAFYRMPGVHIEVLRKTGAALVGDIVRNVPVLERSEHDSLARERSDAG